MGINVKRRGFIKWSGLAAVAGAVSSRASAGSTRTSRPSSKPARLPDRVVRYLDRIYAESNRRYAFRVDYPGGFRKWQADARPVLHRLLGLDNVAALARGHKPEVKLEAPQDQGDYTRQRGHIETEPDVPIPFWLLRPKGDGPFPLAMLPHGHDPRGHDTSAGVYHDDAHRRRTLSGDRDVAVQAVKRGFVAVAPATRGLATDGVPDVFRRHGERDCRSHVMHCLLAGRTAMGERVWDMQRIMDWALARPDVSAEHVLMMGNSGGGMVTLYASACDVRVTIAVPSCSFDVLVSREGRIYHCDCNIVPGILEFGDLYDVAGLIAPRHLLTVNGREDALHSVADITRAADRVRAIYNAAGCPDHFENRFGDQGHRFYKDIMWPFIEKAMQA
jgi:hypothetical protein